MGFYFYPETRRNLPSVIFLQILGSLPKDLDESGCLPVDQLTALDRHMLHCLGKFQACLYIKSHRN